MAESKGRASFILEQPAEPYYRVESGLENLENLEIAWNLKMALKTLKIALNFRKYCVNLEFLARDFLAYLGL